MTVAPTTIGAHQTLDLRRWQPSPTGATVAIVATSVAYAFASFFARRLTEAGLAPTAVTFYRFAITAAVLMPCLATARRHRAAMAWGMASGAVMAIGWIAYVEAIATGDIATAGIAYMTYPVFTVVAAAVFFRVRPTRTSMGAALLVLAGALVGLGGFGGSISPLVLLAPATFGFSIAVLTERMATVDPFARLGSVALGASLALLPAMVSSGANETVPATSTDWVWVVSLGVGAALVPMAIYATAAPVIGAARAATANAAELPVMFAIGAVFFGEEILARHGLAAGLIIGAILLGRATRAPHVLPDEDNAARRQDRYSTPGSTQSIS